ncbi:hypothetical protein [Pseudonocardia nigra]|uniref:hypothetical protein n=1 Tax=Pseudonocardia nigra TaxID=1921578 RepID=UPI001C5E6A36|nr:hypothetical protein [Pseudonocardia nigra]
MTAAATTAGTAQAPAGAASTRVTRIAPSGAPVDLTHPVAFGEYRWYGNTRFTGPRTARQFFLAPAGEHRAIPAQVLPGAREHRQPMRGFDAIVYEAPDRSDSALVLAGPHHEATTWFGGPAPDVAGLTALLSTFRFTDSEQGAALTPVSDLLVQQGDVALIGQSDRSTLLVRRSVDMLPTLPDWAGFALPGGELWRAGRVLGEQAAALVADTPHQWRYLLAGDTAAMDLVLLGPESGLPRTDMAEQQVVEALTALTARWAA